MLHPSKKTPWICESCPLSMRWGICGEYDWLQMWLFKKLKAFFFLSNISWISSGYQNHDAFICQRWGLLSANEKISYEFRVSSEVEHFNDVIEEGNLITDDLITTPEYGKVFVKNVCFLILLRFLKDQTDLFKIPCGRSPRENSCAREIVLKRVF